MSRGGFARRTFCRISASSGLQNVRFAAARPSALPADDRAQLLQPAGDVTFGAVAGGPVIVDAHHFVRRILLRHNAVGVIVGVSITGGVAELLRAGVVAVAQMRGYQSGLARLDVAHRGAQRFGDRVR